VSRSSRDRGLVAALVIGIATGCAAPRTPLLTYQVEPGASPAGALLEGSLAVAPNSRCILLVVPGEAPIGLAWPVGYTATFEPLRIYDATGNEVAAEKSVVSMSGELLAFPDATCRTSSAFRVFTITKGPIKYAT
jgi:hypothetical protein